MPELSRFNGIVISIFYGDHPPKHFHAQYGKKKALISIDTLEVLEGDLPKNELSMIKEWAKLHQKELQANWERAIKREKLEKIKPLQKKKTKK